MGQGVNGVTGRLLARRRGLLGRKRATRVPGARSHDRRQPQGHLPPHRRRRHRHRSARWHPHRVDAGRGDDDRGRVKPRGRGLLNCLRRRRFGHGRFGRTYQVAQTSFPTCSRAWPRPPRPPLPPRPPGCREAGASAGRAFRGGSHPGPAPARCGQVAARGDGVVLGREHEAVILEIGQHFVQHGRRHLRAARPGRRRSSVARHRGTARRAGT